MEREQLKGKQTPGTWVCHDPGMVWCKDDKGQVADTRGVDGHFFAPCESRDQRERHANAVLIAEAGTVAHETGMWPRDLLERVKILEATLRTLRSAIKLQAVKPGEPFCDELREANNAAEYILNK